MIRLIRLFNHYGEEIMREVEFLSRFHTNDKKLNNIRFEDEIMLTAKTKRNS